MVIGNETASRFCKFLDEGYFLELYNVFTEAFSDYVMPFALTETQFRNHLRLTGVDLRRTIGSFENGRMVGFSLNGFGEWQGRSTVYDAGTGVIPSHRRQGFSEFMFRTMLGEFERAGQERFLLEVITNNFGAIDLYTKMGFRNVRELALLQCDRRFEISDPVDSSIEVSEIVETDWQTLRSFWDGEPSWQNSIEAIERSRNLKRLIGAFQDGECVGYAIFSPKFGRLAQMAVRPDMRRRGIGSMLLREMQSATADGFSMQVINIDTSLADARRFFLNRGFYERLSQIEMVRDLRSNGQDPAR